jgi:hypothetical protein
MNASKAVGLTLILAGLVAIFPEETLAVLSPKPKPGPVPPKPKYIRRTRLIKKSKKNKFKVTVPNST